MYRMAKCIDTHIGLAAQPYVEDLSLGKCLEIVGGNELQATRCLQTESNTQLFEELVLHPLAACTLKTEVTYNRLHNNENKHHIGTSLAKGEQTFTRQDDILRKPAAKSRKPRTCLWGG